MDSKPTCIASQAPIAQFNPLKLKPHPKASPWTQQPPIDQTHECMAWEMLDPGMWKGWGLDPRAIFGSLPEHPWVP